MRLIQQAIVTLFLIMLLAPGFQRLTKLFPVVPLYGVENRPDRPRFRLAAWFDGSYQKRYEAAFNARIGFRGQLVRTYNQILFSVFSRTANRRGTAVLVGKNDWLYEKAYVEHYLRGGRASAEDLDRNARELRLLQDELERRGSALVLLISPSKAEIYPEHLPPDALDLGRNPGAQTNYRRMRPLLAAHGVRCVDAHELFLSLKPEAPYPLFAAGGTHWNHYGAFLALRQVVRALQPALAPRPLPLPDLAAVRLRPPEGADKDLALLLNLWRAPGLAAPTPYPLVAAPPSASPRLNLLIVGDSFAFTLIDVLNQARLFDRLDLLYYNRRLFSFAGQDGPFDYGSLEGRPIDARRLDWAALLAGRDAVILETNEMFIQRAGWGFVRAALDALLGPAIRAAHPTAAEPEPEPPSRPGF